MMGFGTGRTPLSTPSTAEQPSSSARGGVAVTALYGAAAGAAGVWVMDRVGSFLYQRENRDALARELKARKGDSTVEFAEAEKEAVDRHPQAGAEAGEDVAHVGAEKLTRLVGSHVRTRQSNSGGLVLHYALGVLPGALHAIIRRRVPVMKAGSGALYGFGLFVLSDEIAAPALGLASGPGAYPWQAHVRGAVAHVVLGVVTESLLRLGDRRS